MATDESYKTLKNRVDTLVTLLDYDLNTANANGFADYTGDERRDLIGEMSYTLGVYEECLSQARKHIEMFKEEML